jgi:hypothetical protein
MVYMYEIITIVNSSIRLLLDNKLSEQLSYCAYCSYYINTGLCICIMSISVLVYNFDK